ncbi:hypothetical protein BSKO_03411 [Bryopsis sp. KO-2023]|nr:hypothetical protein BSKO_03411 [Bryopsis sp. KO-2023]
MNQDFKVVGGKETAPPNGRKIRCFLVIFLLNLCIGASFVSLTGTREGWAKVCKSGLIRDQSPYAGAIKYLFSVDPDPSNASPLLIDAIEFQLPPGETAPFDIKVTEGWLDLETSVWITGGGRVDPHLHVLARIMTAEKYHKKLNEILVDGQSSLVEDYNVWLFSFIIYISEYVVLAVGTHRDLKKNPLVRQGIIPWPDWGWFIAIMGATCWLGVWTLCRRNDDSLNFRETIASWSVGSKKSWTISSANEITVEKDMQNEDFSPESTGKETESEERLDAIP